MTRRIFTSLGFVIVLGLAALVFTFTARTLPFAPLAAGTLPPAAPPPEMSLSALPTGAMHARAAFAYRGGAFGEPRDFGITGTT